MKAKMNIKARNNLLDILIEKGIEIRELEIEIEEAYENYYEREEDKRQGGLLSRLVDYGDWVTLKAKED